MDATTTFAWYGLRFDHPSDWAPAVLSGKREEGYARLAGLHGKGAQLRWHSAKSLDNPEQRLKRYFERLQRDAKREGLTFTSELEVEASGIAYRWLGHGQGRGKLFFHEESSRIVFLEAYGNRKDSLLPVLGALLSGFGSADSFDRELWSVAGLQVYLPKKAAVTTSKFASGQTRLEWRSPGCRWSAERWGLAKQLLAAKDLETWSRAALGLAGYRCLQDDEGLRFSKSGILKAEALVRFDEASNRIASLKCVSRKRQECLDWKWIPI